MAVDLGLTFGALLLGVLIASTAYGLTIVQTYIYFDRFPNDDMINKITVWLLFVLETFHTAISWHMIYYYLILNFGNLGTFLEQPIWSLSTLVIVTHIIEFTRQCFYARRVFFLSGRSVIISMIILVLATIGAGFGIVVGVRFDRTILASIHPTIYSWGVTSIVGLTSADMVITVSSIYYLKQGKRGNYAQTESLLDKLMLWTGSTGMITSTISLAFLGAFIGAPDALVYLALDQILTRVYVNTLLATLNFRAVLRGRAMEEDTNPTMHLSIMQSTPRGQYPGLDHQKSSTIVHVVTHTQSDGDVELGNAVDKTTFEQRKTLDQPY
ncbi:MFS general substrate transporter [Mycena sanguinolenta]|uniref:MFS general substrate transporter n=1 Tax=Mycena sanguinolenta TaxID=230812 RepID=A0A8H6YUY7_9AGAR|nr:MFS general substrate transporter [Mycena sanguinolenta]